MKIAVAYTIYDGTELLEKSIKQFFPFVDHIILCYQTTSNTGQNNPELINFLNRFRNEGKFTLLKFVPTLTKNPKYNEIRKHDLMLQTARSLGATHLILSACDHFYNSDMMELCIADTKRHDYDISFSKMYTYYKYPTWQLDPPEDYFMPFLIKIKPDNHIANVSPIKYPVLVDPAVRVTGINIFKVYRECELMMDHYSMVRENMMEKLSNSASKFPTHVIIQHMKEYDEYNLDENKGVSYFGGRKIKVVPNYYGL